MDRLRLAMEFYRRYERSTSRDTEQDTSYSVGGLGNHRTSLAETAVPMPVEPMPV